MLNAKNGRLSIPTGEMDYICFGSGSKTLVMIPGVGDGLKTVKKMKRFINCKLPSRPVCAYTEVPVLKQALLR